MSKSEMFGREAEEGLPSRNVPRNRIRAVFVKMAHEWRGLAQQQERTERTTDESE